MHEKSALPPFLILTVGTGTAGKSSNLIQGLINTLHQAKPRRFWLVPSTAPDSIEVANLVREGAPDAGAFQPWAATNPYRCIIAPDDIFDCRFAVREVISIARRDLREGEQLIVNPTSGTKQMSAGATLAALDEGIGEIVFTVGERADGVVKTGTERLAPFSTATFFLERDLRNADELFRSGSFFGAARLLQGYTQADALRAREIAWCLHEWQRLNYNRAASHAAKFSQDLREHLKRLDQTDGWSFERLGDLLASADELIRWGDFEEALARFYRATELLARRRLKEIGREQHESRWGKLWEELRSQKDPLAQAFFLDRPLRESLQDRNDTVFGHGSKSVSETLVRDVRVGLARLLQDHLPKEVMPFWKVPPRPQTLRSA